MVSEQALSLMSRIFSALGRHLSQLVCGLHGHLILLHFEPTKLSVRCVDTSRRVGKWATRPRFAVKRAALRRVRSGDELFARCLPAHD